MIIRIELLSDLCSYSGEVYNTVVDTDVVYDNYGLPYIPAKRIKGCIRESALDLQKMGLISHYEEIFGKEGNRQSCFTLSNAYIENYDKTVNALASYPVKALTEKQKVLAQYTYTRTQTAIDNETGSAIENSLRTLRVVKKGMVFEAELHFNDAVLAAHKEYIDEFTKAVSITKHMGISRTRGLGLVSMSCLSDNQKQERHLLFDKQKLTDSCFMEYSIHLKSNMICKSSLGNEAKSEDFIDGGKVLGIIAGALGKEEYQKIMNDIIVSNAYIEVDGKRTIPGRNSLQKVKNQKYKNGAMKIVDMMYHNPNKGQNLQYTPANIAYISDNGKVTSVDTEISYHHQRPDDKSIGHVTSSNGQFYQLGSICSGQTFKGYISASKNVEETIVDAIRKLGSVRMGYGKNSEFGEVTFTLDSVKNISVNEINKTIFHDAELSLIADMILYNDNGMLVADIKTLESYLRSFFGVEDIKVETPFVTYKTIGGFNVTWGRRKQIFNAIAKGSVMKLHSEKGIPVTMGAPYFIGERNSEGYGEVKFTPVKDNEEVIVYKAVENKIVENENTDQTIIKSLLEKECEKQIDYIIRDTVKTKLNNSSNLNSAVAKLRLMYRMYSTYDKLNFEVNELENAENCKKLASLIVPNDVVDTAIKYIQVTYNDPKFALDWNDSHKFKTVYYSYLTELKNLVKTDRSKEEK